MNGTTMFFWQSFNLEWYARLVYLPILIVWLVLSLTLAGCQESLNDVQYVERARNLRDKGDLRSSIIDLKSALQQNPKNLEARALLGQIYVEVGDGVSAEKELLVALKEGMAIETIAVPLAKAFLLQGKHADLLKINLNLSNLKNEAKAAIFALRGRAFIIEGDLEQADKQLKLALQANEDSVDTWFGLAVLAYSRQQWPEAHSWLDKVLKVRPDAEALGLQGDLALVQDQFAEAGQAYSEALALQPLSPNIAYQTGLAIAQIGVGKLDESIKNLDIVLKLFPDYAYANYLRAVAAYRQKNYQDAQFYGEKALTGDSNDLRYRLIVGTASYFAGNYQNASQHLGYFSAKMPNYAPASKLLAAALLKLRSPEQAAAVLKSVEPSSDNDVQLFLAVGNAVMLRGNSHSGRVLFEQIVSAQPDNAAARAQLGVARLAAGDDEGIEDLQSAVAADPKLTSAEIALIIAYLRAGEYNQALELALHLQEKQPDDPNGFILAGIAHGAKGNEAEAKVAFTKALTLKPGDPSASHNLAAYAERADEFDQARKIYQDVLIHNAGYLPTLLKLAALERRAGRLQEAKATLVQAMNQNPNAIQPRVMVSQIYLDTFEPQKVLDITAQAFQQFPNDPGLLDVIGRARLQLGQTSGAVAAFQDLIKTRPQSANAYLLLAQAYERANDKQAMHKALDQALVIQPNYFLAGVVKTRALIQDGNFKEAEQRLTDLSRLQPRHAEVASLKGELALRQRRFREAVVAFQEALTLSPNSSQLVVQLAQAQWQMGDKEASLNTDRTWLEKNPADLLVQYQLANSYLLLGRLQEAKASFAKVLDTAPDHVLSLNNLAWLLRDEDPKKALQYAERAVGLAPNLPVALDTLGVLLLEQGQTERALALLRKAVSASNEANNQDMRYHLALALSRQGKKSEARDILQAILAAQQPFENREAAQSLLQSIEH